LTTEGIDKGQVNKGSWWMPWHQQRKKDAAGCEKPRGAASEQRSVDIRMGQPNLRKVRILYAESTGRTQGSETSQYLEEKKSSEIPPVAASEGGRAQTNPTTKKTACAVGSKH
jgi:hypothetical protein